MSTLCIIDNKLHMTAKPMSTTYTYSWPLKPVRFEIGAGKNSVPLIYRFESCPESSKCDKTYYYGNVQLVENSNEIDIGYSFRNSCAFQFKTINISFSIIDNKNEILFKKTEEYVKLSTFVTSNRITNFQVKGFINKTLYNTLVRSTVSQSKYYLLHQVTLISEGDLYFVETYDITEENKIKALTHNFNILLKDQYFSDITLKSNDGKEFKAHKSILAAQSDVFLKMFVHDMKEKKEGIIEISDIASDVLEELINFMYTGKLNNIEQVASEMILIADKYNIEGLKMLCSQEIKKNLTTDNAIDILLLADTSNCEDLVSTVINFMVLQGSASLKTAKFKALKESHSHLMGKFVNLMIEYY